MKRKLLPPTDAEDAAINAAIGTDPDTYELSDEEFARLRPFSRGPGRPVGSGRKIPVTMRLDADVVAAFRAEGSGWQTRMNDALREWLREHRGAA
ncbi:BrnA antitoxin family protein [Geminicoccus harenae]|uniref:BrnA antitoxin family protein n=1 Tax=Geminicoccus harenae TaxID=2498453 RepID=UPI00168A5737|nr:BrnA antitoxin family protein [Geminicoccus harenae]